MNTVADVMRRYAVTEWTVLTWIRTGQLRAFNVGRNQGAKRPRWRVTAAALEEFEAKRTPASPVPSTRRAQRPADVIEFYS